MEDSTKRIHMRFNGDDNSDINLHGVELGRVTAFTNLMIEDGHLGAEITRIIQHK